MKIIIEKSKESLIVHSLFLVSILINVARIVRQEETWTHFNMLLWNIIAYILYFYVTALKAANAKLKGDIAQGIVGKFEKFMNDNKESLLEDVKNGKDIVADLDEKK